MRFALFVCILVSCLLPAVLHGCAPVTMTKSNARGLCLASSSFSGSCLDVNAVCDGFQVPMSGNYSSARECREACDATNAQMNTRMPTMGCGPVLSRGRGYCNQYCNFNYPQ